MMKLYKNIYVAFALFLKEDRGLADNTVKAYCKDAEILMQFIFTHYGNLPIYDLKMEHFQSWIKWLNEVGFVASSQVRMIIAIKLFIAWLYSEGYVEVDDAGKLEYPVTATNMPVILTTKEIDSLIASAKSSTYESQRNVAIIELLYSTGIKAGELVRLNVEDLNVADELITVTSNRGDRRVIPVGVTAVMAIYDYCMEERGYKRWIEGGTNILFVSKNGNPLNESFIYHIVTSYAKKINLQKKINVNTFRHTFAVHMLEGGCDLVALNEILGHVSILQTAKYEKMNVGYLRKQMQKAGF